MQIALNTPFRIWIGRFGIWLMHLGRWLQLRYANWNHEFRLQVETHPNPNVCTFHVSAEVTEESILSFTSRNSQPLKAIPLVEDLFNIRGVAQVNLSPYKVCITKGRVFTWDELRPQIEETLLRHLTK